MSAGRKRTSHAAGSRRERARADWVLVSLAGAGAVLTAYLSYSKWQAAALPFCAAGSGCDVVQESRWSMLLGLPIAAWGCLTYLALLAAGLGFKDRAARWRLCFLIAVCGFAISAYLTVVGLVALSAACGYCLVSLALMSAVLVWVWRARGSLADSGSWQLGSSALAVVAVLLLHVHYSGVFDAAAGPEDPYLADLARHLNDSGAVFYGAYWCPRCQEQKDLFGASAKRLPYVECTPDGRNKPRADACIDQRIGAYPTWVIGGQRYTRVLEPEALARHSRYESRADLLSR